MGYHEFLALSQYYHQKDKGKIKIPNKGKEKSESDG